MGLFGRSKSTVRDGVRGTGEVLWDETSDAATAASQLAEKRAAERRGEQQ